MTWIYNRKSSFVLRRQGIQTEFVLRCHAVPSRNLQPKKTGMKFSSNFSLYFSPHKLLFTICPTATLKLNFSAFLPRLFFLYLIVHFIFSFINLKSTCFYALICLRNLVVSIVFLLFFYFIGYAVLTF